LDYLKCLLNIKNIIATAPRADRKPRKIFDRAEHLKPKAKPKPKPKPKAKPKDYGYKWTINVDILTLS